MMKKINTILLVDDDYTTNLFNSLIIKRGKIAKNVVDVNSGEKAIDYLLSLNNELPDIVLLDINMPVMNGWEMLDYLQEINEPRLQKVKIFMLSASVNPDDVKKSKEYKYVYGYIPKPLKVDSLLQSI